MKKVFFTLLWLLATMTLWSQVYSEWHPISSPHKEIKEVTFLCGNLLATDERNLWRSVNTGKAWDLIDEYIPNTIPATGFDQDVYINPNGVAVIRRTGYPGTAYVYSWECNTLTHNSTYSINTNMYDNYLDVGINHDKDEFLKSYFHHSPNPSNNFCSMSKSSNASSWVSLPSCISLTPDTFPTYSVENDSLYKKDAENEDAIAYIPSIVNGRKALTYSYIEDSVWCLTFKNGQIATSFDQGLSWDTCTSMSQLQRVNSLSKNDFGIYFRHGYILQKITSPTSYVTPDALFNPTEFRHKNQIFKMKWSSIYRYDSLAFSWKKLYHFPLGKIAKNKNELFFYGKQNMTNFIFSSNDAGAHWQIHTTPIIISTMVATSSQWFIFDVDNQIVNTSNNLGQTWTDVSVSTPIDTIYSYKEQVFLVGKDVFYSWNKKNGIWDMHSFGYSTFTPTNYRLDEFLLFRREVQDDSLYNFYVTDLAFNQSRKVMLPSEFVTKPTWGAEYQPGATDYLLDKGALYICDKFHHLGIKYAYCEPSTDTLFVKKDFCPEQGLVLGDTTLFFASTDTIQFVDNFHTVATAVLDIAPYDSVPTIHRDTSLEYRDLLFGQEIYADTVFYQYFNTVDGCDSIVEWNVSILVATASIDNHQFAVSPNPSSGQVFVRSDENISDIQLSVVNMLGEVVLVRTIDTNTNIDLFDLPRGSYYLLFRKKEWESHLFWVKI